jgi:phosphotransferase system enzyme I (PtsI)
MICCQKELHQAKEVLEEAKEQLRAKGQAFTEEIEVGMMIEVPSAAFLSAEFARQVDFFSIGTNDLIQYLLAVDRQNRQVAYLYNPLHLSVLRLLRQIVDDAHRAGIHVAMCGEMAGTPEFINVVLGLGIDEVSMNPLALPYVRHLIRNSSFEESHKLVEDIMNLDESDKIQATVRTWMAHRFPDFFSEEGPADIFGGL